MKTVIIYDQCGEDDIKFRVVDGDFTHLQGKYVNSVDTSDAEADEINTVVFDENWHLLGDFTTEFPVEAVREGAKVVVIGFLP